MADGMLITIRKMQPEDSAFIAEIEKNCFSEPWSAKAFAEAAQNKEYIYLTALDCNAVVGYAGCILAGEEADITNIAVSEKYRRMGIGQELLRQLTLLAGQNGVTEMFLEVRQSNMPAQSLYSGMGFEAVGIRRNFYRKPGEDAVIMKYTFTRE